jgi:hypothetical protein
MSQEEKKELINLVKVRYQLDNMRITLLAFFTFLSVSSLHAQQKLELKSLLKDYYDFSTLPFYLSHTYSAQESSYDRTGYNDDGFGGKYSFVRRNPDSSLVLLDIKGPGVLNRIWTPTPTDDTLEFYIDNDATPVFTIRYRDLFTGKVYPFVAPLSNNQLGGFYCYLPMPFQASCKIILKGKHTRFHQIGYRLYPKGTVTKSFSLPLDPEEKQELEKIQKLWAKKTFTANDLYSSPVTTINKNVSLKPSQSAVIYQGNTPGRLAGFEIISATEMGALAKNIDLRISYDNDPSPAIYCPIADYFGYSFGKASMAGLLIGSDGRNHYSWFPMPFDKSVKIELIYRPVTGTGGINTVNLLFKVHTISKKRNPATEGKFYAHWNRENPVATGKPFTMLDIKGKGHFTGVALQSQGLVSGITGFFEGDDSTVVDGELRMHGTGSEDFFNGGWYALLDCWDAGLSLPLSGSLEYSIPLSRTGGYRFLITDKVSYNNTFLQTIEHGPELNRWPSDYTSVSYFYNDRPVTQSLNPANANTKIFVPDTLEIYPQLIPATMDNSLSVEAKWAYPVPAKTMFYTVKSNSLIQLSLRDIPEGNYRIHLDYVRGPAAASFSLWQRQQPLTEWIDAFQNNSERIPLQPVGSIHIDRLNNSFSFQFRTAEGRNQFILSRVVLVRMK